MNRYFQMRAAIAAVGLCCFTAMGHAQAPPPSPNPPAPASPSGSQDDVEVMTRGPVHEAYAEPVVRGEGAPLIATQKPPDAIEELPPDSKPEGENVAWISGYWAWDQDRKDYIWVSGVWRTVPANQTWVPGYWTEAEGGYRWVSGFWMPQQNEDVEYLAEPPATLEQGPTSAAPSTDYFWNPGCWSWYETRYVWRPGFWTVCQPDWIWVPAHYRWTPRGWIFIPGYWDYPLVRRGVLFAPICFRRPLLHWHRFRWSPAVVIQPSVLSFYLFVRPNYCHYYFGDYYAVSYEGLGFRPWFHYHGARGFDPLFTYYRWYNPHHLHDRDWEHNIHGWFTYYRGHEHERPPHTLLAQHQLIGKGKGRADFQQLQIGTPIKNLTGHKDSFVKLTTISVDQRTKITAASRQFGELKKQRWELESGGHGKPALKPDVKIGKADLPAKPGGRGKPGETRSNLTLKQPEKVRLPNKLDLGGLGAKQSQGLTATVPATPKSGATGSRTGATGSRVTPPDAKSGVTTPKSGVTGPKPITPGTKSSVTTPKTGVTGPPSGVQKSTQTPSGSGKVKQSQPAGAGSSSTIRREPGGSGAVPKSTTPPGTSGPSGSRRSAGSSGGGSTPTFKQPAKAPAKQPSGAVKSSGQASGSVGGNKDKDNRDRR